MKRFWIIIIVVGIAIVAVSAFQYLTRPKQGDVAPQFKLPTLSGKIISQEGLKGKPVILHFWASWCGACKLEFESLARLYADFKNKELHVLAVSEDGEGGDEAVRLFLKNLDVSFPILMDRDGRVADEYHSFGLPESIFIDRNGMIVSRRMGVVDWDSAAVREEVRSLIMRPAEGK